MMIARCRDPRRCLLVLALAALAGAGCSNASVNQDWHRSRTVAEGRRPAGLVGVVEPAVIEAGPGAGAGVRVVEPVLEEATPPAEFHADPRMLPMFDGSTGTPLSWTDLIDRALNADVVLIGEVHGHSAAQAFLPAFFSDLVARAPTAWLSLEFFERDQQTALDDYLSGITDEREMRELTRRNDGNFPPGHRAMLETAKQFGRPVVASNAPRRYARLARTAGFERLQSLGLEQQKLFVIPSMLTSGRYRSDFDALMGPMLDHGHKQAAEAAEQREAAAQGDTTPEPADRSAKLEGYYRAQNLWDATMADSIARPVFAGARPVVHVVGQFHSDYAGGLTERLRSTLAPRNVMTISLVDESTRGGARRDEDAARAEVVVYLR